MQGLSKITYRDENIAAILEMTVDEALLFFALDPPVKRALHTLHEVGLGYLRLGQSARELSGGEAQRIKLATELHGFPRNSLLHQGKPC